jgi:hypothetical protein
MAKEEEKGSILDDVAHVGVLGAGFGAAGIVHQTSSSHLAAINVREMIRTLE